MSQRRKELFSRGLPWLLGLVLTASILVVYWPVRNHEFIDFDDTNYVTQNPNVRAGINLRGLLWSFTATHAGNWHPVTWLSHMVDVEMYGLKPAGHHVTNVLLHAANTILLFFLLIRMTGALWQSGFAAAVFALHPLQVESVAWVAERKNVLSTLFWMLTTWAYLRYVKRSCASYSSLPSSLSPLPSGEEARRKVGWLGIDPERMNSYLLIIVLFVLGLMSKPMLVTLPFVLLLLDYWPLRRFEPDHWKARIGPLIQEKVPLLLLSAAASLVTFVVQQKGGMVKSVGEFPFWERLANIVTSYIQYILKFIYPSSLAILYPYPDSFPWWKVLGGSLFLVWCTVMVIRSAKKYPYLAVGWFWYTGTLVPVIGLVQVGLQAMADRYAYVPLIGLLIMIAPCLRGLLSRRVTLALSAGVPLALFLIIARIQVSYWQNSIRLFEHTLSVTDSNPVMHNMQGLVLADKGRFREAAGHFAAALRINPRYSEAGNNLGLALAKQGFVEDAIAFYNRALRANPDDAQAHNNLGNILNSQGKSEEALFHLNEAVRIQPHYVQAHNNIGIALVRQGRIQEAMVHYMEALRIDPGSAEAHNNLGVALAGQKRMQEAMAHYTEALRINPDYAEAQSNLGVALAQQGKIQNATVYFERAIAVDPQYEKAYHNLGVALSDQGRHREAIPYLIKALQLKPDFVEALYSLGLAYAAAGNRGAALEQIRTLNALNPELAKRLSGGISRREYSGR